MADAAVVRARVVLELEDGRTITYTIRSPRAASVRALGVPVGDVNHGKPAIGAARQFSVTFGWQNGGSHV